MNQKMKRRLFFLSGLLAWPVTAVAGNLLSGRRLRRRCSLPCYDYATDRFGNPASASSTRGIGYLTNGSGAFSPVAADNDTREVLKTFQLEDSFLQIDHCRISRVVVTVSSRGNWTISLTAQQDPLLVTDPVLRPQFERFRRNQFRVDVRPVGLMEQNPTIALSKLGKPEFPFIEAQEFWVQKGQILPLSFRGRSGNLARYFHVIQQVEIHFSCTPKTVFVTQTPDTGR